MEFTQEGLDLLTRFEGCILTAYKCPAGIWTIGFGTTKGVTPNMKISPAVAQTLLLADLQEVEEFISDNVSCPLSDNQYSALICLVYNIGIAAFTRSKLLRLLNSGTKKEEVAQEFLRWVTINKKVSNGLKRRRQEEKNLFLKA